MAWCPGHLQAQVRHSCNPITFQSLCVHKALMDEAASRLRAAWGGWVCIQPEVLFWAAVRDRRCCSPVVHGSHRLPSAVMTRSARCLHNLPGLGKAHGSALCTVALRGGNAAHHLV